MIPFYRGGSLLPLNGPTDSGQPIVPPPDVQRTTFLDVLGRFVCSAWDEATRRNAREIQCIVECQCNLICHLGHESNLKADYSGSAEGCRGSGVPL